MADPKAALAKAMLESGGHVKWEGNGGWAEAIMLNHAEAALRFLGCVNSKGEVVAPERGAVADVIATLEALLTAPITKGTCIMARSRVVELLTALRGEGGEE